MGRRRSARMRTRPYATYAHDGATRMRPMYSIALRDADRKRSLRCARWARERLSSGAALVRRAPASTAEPTAPAAIFPVLNTDERGAAPLMQTNRSPRRTPSYRRQTAIFRWTTRRGHRRRLPRLRRRVSPRFRALEFGSDRLLASRASPQPHCEVLLEVFALSTRRPTHPELPDFLQGLFLAASPASSRRVPLFARTTSGCNDLAFSRKALRISSGFADVHQCRTRVGALQASCI